MYVSQNDPPKLTPGGFIFNREYIFFTFKNGRSPEPPKNHPTAPRNAHPKPALNEAILGGAGERLFLNVKNI